MTQAIASQKRPIPQTRLYRFLSFYPPFFGAGIRSRYARPDFHVELKQTWFNRNAVGTHFGGSLYAMCDPFYMLILMEQLGADYVVWDKAATIQFIRPGRGTMHADFHIPQESLQDIRARADRGEKIEPVFPVDVLDSNNQVVARVEKRLYVRRKEPREGSGSSRGELDVRGK